MKNRSFSRRFSFTWPHYLFVFALTIRLIALAHLSGSPFLLPSGGDMHFYDHWAQGILRGRPASAGAFYGLPGYAYLLAAIYKVCGYGPFVPGLLQAVLDAATAVLIFKLTQVVLGNGWNSFAGSAPGGFSSTIATHSREIVAAIAGVSWVFFVPAEAYSVVLMPTTIAIFVFVFVIWWIARNSAKPGPLECLCLGLLVGLSATVVATVLFLALLLMAALILRENAGPGTAAAGSQTWSRRRLMVLGLVLLFLGIGAGTSPCWIHNYFVAHDPVILSAHSGINFWIGNNPEANGYPRFPPGLRAGQAAMLEDSISAAESAAGHPLKRAEVSRFWSDKAKRFIRENPGRWVGLELRKLRNLLSAFQYDDLSIITTLREQGVIFPGIYFGVVAAFAIPGMFVLWRSAAARWIAAGIFLQVCALLPVFVTERYRLPIVPGLLVFASAGLATGWRALAAGQRQIAAIYFSVLAGSTLLVSWPQRNPSLWALDAYNTGRQAVESGNLALADRDLSLARAYVPDNAETNFALGNLRLAQGKRAEATAFYRQTLLVEPKHKGALNNLGVIALDDGDPAAARIYLRGALAQDPRNAKTYFLLAKAAIASGDLGTARRELAEAIRLAPGQPEFLALEQQLAVREQTP